RRGMASSTVEMEVPDATAAEVTENELRVALSDGRTLSVPLTWFPRLVHGTETERNNFRLIGRGQGIHWTDLDEDISVEGLLAGRPSAESQASLKAWLEQRVPR
ncbi:MAG: DUF2442 domain-containing protein, partial [Dehalococcoidia bacterium]